MTKYSLITYYYDSFVISLYNVILYFSLRFGLMNSVNNPWRLNFRIVQGGIFNVKIVLIDLTNQNLNLIYI